MPDTVTDLDIFDGNVGIITVTRDHIINSNISTEEQIYTILSERKAMHSKFLDGSDPVVSTIESEIQNIFISSRCDIAMSYVFTLYAFPDKEWVKPELLITPTVDAEWLKTTIQISGMGLYRIDKLVQRYCGCGQI